jgi:hypothetical protein
MDSFEELFYHIKEGLLNIDPVTWIEKNLNLDGKPFRINGNGYKPFADIYRYIGIKALERDSKPIILVKGRQVGATTMAAALECFFMSSGLFGNNGRPPIRVIHAFPLMDLAAAYSNAKLAPMITGANPSNAIVKSKNARNKSVVEDKIDKSSASNDNVRFKQFIGGNQLWIESTGIDGNRLMGKQLALDTELPTPNGFIKLSDLKKGDELFDEQGNICKVTILHPIQISPESYRITFNDGTIVDACADHLWLTYTKKDRKALSKFKNGKSKYKPIPKVKNTKNILQTLKVFGKNNHSIPNCLPLNYSEKNLLIDPYLLGLYLAGENQEDGCIETANPEILKEYSYHVVSSSVELSKSCSYRIDGLTSKLAILKLIPDTHNKIGDIYNKYIPDIYIHSSFKQRLALLQGLLDSNGHCEKNGIIEFTHLKKDLSYQVYELILSLGIKANISKNKTTLNGKIFKDSYRIRFITKLPVFRLASNLKNLRNDNKYTISNYRFISKIEKIESVPMRCITVDSPSHLFLITRSFIPTHNTGDVFFADEAQKMRKTAIANSTKILSQAQYGKKTKGVQVYFGTPLQSGSAYWDMWNSSSQQYYYLGCKKCNQHFPLFTGNDDWEEIWLYGYVVRCTHCGFEQDKLEAAENGKWVSLNKKADTDYVGFHINQLYNPMYTKEDIIKEKPENSPVNTKRAYYNEVLGIFYSGSAAPISAEEIYEKCADHKRKFTASISINEPRKAYAGFDWGDLVDQEPGNNKGIEGSSKQSGQSYSCGVILTSDSPHILSIEFALKLKRNDPESKKEVVEQMFRQYSVQLAVGDIGYANDLTYNLQKEHGDKFLASRSCPSVKNHVRFEDSIFPKEIQFEKDYYIKELYDLMKAGRIRFPYGSYEQIGWLIGHCCSMELKQTMDRSGEMKLRYVKGSSPNDGFMALLNAYIAYKYDITSGFKIHDPNKMSVDPKERKQIPCIIGYVPQMNPLNKKRN